MSFKRRTIGPCVSVGLQLSGAFVLSWFAAVLEVGESPTGLAPVVLRFDNYPRNANQNSRVGSRRSCQTRVHRHKAGGVLLEVPDMHLVEVV